MLHATQVTSASQAMLPGVLERPPQQGLSTSDAIARAAAGLTNRDGSSIRTDGDVVRANVLTFFNVILAALIIALLAVGEIKDGAFVGIVVIANVAVSTLQELRATRTLRELRALTAPKATVIRDGQAKESKYAAQFEAPALAEDPRSRCGEDYSTLTRGSARSFISSLTPHTIASARSGLLPGGPS